MGRTPNLSAKKSGTPLPFQKFSYKVENRPKSAKNCQNLEKLLKVAFNTLNDPQKLF
jgi:hypothetical protein